MNARSSRHHRPLRPLVVGVGLCLVLFCLYFVTREPHGAVAWKQQLQQDRQKEDRRQQQQQQKTQHQTQHRPNPNVLRSLSLTEKQCQAEFPGLTQSIDEIVAEGPFRLKNTGDMGALQGRIKNGKIFIINAQRRSDLSEQMLNSRTAAIHQLHRALLTSPEPVPDTYFSINFQDQPFGTAWGYSRAINPAFRSKDRDERNFLMPHFSFWGWRLPFVGSICRAAAAIDRLERETYPSFNDKMARAVWRGTTWFNSVHSPRLRQNLLAVAKGQSWADVEALDWVGGGGSGRGQSSGQNATNALAIEDFCRYRYVLHTEGVAYSGRFQFLQMCGSVTITPPIVWMQHTTHLVKPVFSSHLLAAATKPTTETKQQIKNEPPRKAAQKFAHAVKKAGQRRADRSVPVHHIDKKPSGHKSWPVSYPADEANIVFVAPDWSDLKDTVAWLEAHPDIAAGIARNQRDLFVGGGYFSPAAEVCYWRALVRGWARVVKVDPKEWAGREEMSYESFTLNNGH